ncbi:hypothetical protein [[Flexibacter] sp. ATCC 35208]|uniref:hypothetical protein n=1 Tax=[Flexibacter] sp. ATCC 35208 TaxID=1936242 RepID=UPI0009D39AE7|nr:hypothetical protein [[Flexibacter] sp. ATCC 35208]OMP74909.1 hypothetical protein BW716_32985 [[Flexibacter] sp. ATCC 35208]
MEVAGRDDRLGRLVTSQNAEQVAPVNGGATGRYSYTKYDAQGRVIEVGEKSGASLTGSEIFMSSPEVFLGAFRSNGKDIPKESILNIYKELAERIVSNAPGVEASQRSPNALAEQTRRLEMIKSMFKISDGSF